MVVLSPSVLRITRLCSLVDAIVVLEVLPKEPSYFPMCDVEDYIWDGYLDDM